MEMEMAVPTLLTVVTVSTALPTIDEQSLMNRQRRWNCQ